MAYIEAADFLRSVPTSKVTFTEVVSSKGNTTVVKGSDGKTYILKGGAGGVNSRNNNPGAMKYGPRAKKFGAIGQTAPPPGSKDGLGYAIFPTYNAGVQAYADLQQTRNGNKTIEQMVADYARDEALPAYGSYAADLANAAGVSPGTRISDLTPQQFAQMQAKQFEIEGAGTPRLTVTDSQGRSVNANGVFGARLVPPGNVPETAVATQLDVQPRSTGRTIDAAVQTQLRNAGFNPGASDGINGPRTQAAIKAFQSRNGLTVDGIVGPQTLAALQRATTTPRSAPSPAPSRGVGVAPQNAGGVDPIGAGPGSYPTFTGLLNDMAGQQAGQPSNGFNFTPANDTGRWGWQSPFMGMGNTVRAAQTPSNTLSLTANLNAFNKPPAGAVATQTDTRQRVRASQDVFDRNKAAADAALAIDMTGGSTPRTKEDERNAVMFKQGYRWRMNDGVKEYYRRVNGKVEIYKG